MNFITIENAFLYNANQLIFNNLSLKIKQNETWAIVGATGAGKSSFLSALRGNLLLRKGRIVYFFKNENFVATEYWDVDDDLIAEVSFKENSHIFKYDNHYLQQRYNATESDESVLVKDYLQYENYDEIDFGIVCNKLKVTELLNLNLLKLSNGQTRRVRIAKALLKKPALLLLDNPFAGLDKTTRQLLHEMIDAIVKSGVQVILVTTRTELPESVTHILELDNFKIKKIYPKKDYLEIQNTDNQSVVNSILEKFKRKKIKFNANSKIPLIDFRNIKVNYGEKIIINNLNWTIKKGEKWALLGKNGVGKTTLLSLITGDNPQAYRNDIRLFGKNRKHWSIWEIKEKIGFLSPELHLYFEAGITCEQVAATGYFDTMDVQALLKPQQQKNINILFQFFDLEHLQEADFANVSTGEQRLVLFIRAFVKDPPLLILDEPFQGMDEKMIEKATNLLKFFCDQSKTLILVTHYENEIPAFITNRYEL